MSRGNTVNIGIFMFICIIPEQFIVSIIFLYPYTTVGIWKGDVRIYFIVLLYFRLKVAVFDVPS